MYGKIARLSLLDGCCWSSNSFLDSTRTGRNASRFIAELKDSGYISIENERSKSRKIRIYRIDSKINLANFGDVDEFGKNNLANSGDVEESENANLANSGDVEETENANLANSGDVEEPKNANLAKFGDRTSSSSLNLYNKTTTTSGDDLPTVEKVVAAYFSPNEIKTALLALDKVLIFDDVFYTNAAAFMAKKEIGLKYLSWLHEQCCLKENIRSFKAYYFSVFFLDNVADEYKAAQLQPSELPESKPPPRFVVCEACGVSHSRFDAKCPSCGLPEYSPPDQISLYRELHKLPPDKREEYLHRQNSLYEECGFNFEKLTSALAALNHEYCLTISQ